MVLSVGDIPAPAEGVAELLRLSVRALKSALRGRKGQRDLSSIPVLLQMNLNQMTSSALGALSHDTIRNPNSAPGFDLYDGIMLYVANRYNTPLISEVLPRFMHPGLNGTLPLNRFRLVVDVSQSAYIPRQENGEAAAMRPDKQAANLRKQVAWYMDRIAPSVAAGDAWWPSSDEVKKKQIISGIVFSEWSDQLWRLASSTGRLNCGGTKEAASVWTFDPACLESQLDPFQFDYAGVGQSVQREGLVRQFDGSHASLELIAGGSTNYIVPRNSTMVARCAVEALTDKHQWSANVSRSRTGLWWLREACMGPAAESVGKAIESINTVYQSKPGQDNSAVPTTTVVVSCGVMFLALSAWVVSCMPCPV